MNRKNVSVVLTTYNGAQFIKKQIASILEQTILPEEIIICDDVSTDETVSIVSTFINNGLVKIIVNVNATQLGVMENFKKGVKGVQPGNWIIFSDQDDIWLSHKISSLTNEMHMLDDNTTPALIFTDLTVIDKHDAVREKSFWKMQNIKPEKINLASLLYGNIVTGCTMMINYAMANEFFDQDNSEFLHDEWLSLIAYSFGKVKFLNEQLVLYRQHTSNVTFSENNKTITLKDILKQDVDYLFRRKIFLSHQFDLAKAFLLKYRNRLADRQIKTIESFIKLENKNYLLQRLARKIIYS